jgi:hypothetical protein
MGTFLPSELNEEDRARFAKEMMAEIVRAEGQDKEDAEAMEGPDLQAFLALPYSLGDIQVRPLGINSLALLEYLGNPLLDDGTEEAGPWDTYEFLYVLSHEKPEELATSGYEHSRRLRLIQQSEAIAKQSPDFYEKYLVSLDNVTERYFNEWEDHILEFSKRLEGVTVLEMQECIARVMQDAYRQSQEVLEQVDESKEDDSKKKRTVNRKDV